MSDSNQRTGAEVRLDGIDASLRDGREKFIAIFTKIDILQRDKISTKIFTWIISFIIFSLAGMLGYLGAFNSGIQERATAIAVIQVDLKHVQTTLGRIERIVNERSDSKDRSSSRDTTSR